MPKKRLKWILGSIFLLVGLVLIWPHSYRTLEIEKETGPAIEDEKVSPLSGLNCQNYQGRPIAVILAEDPVARPLAGLREADLIFEMPVITGEMTRLMAVYVCGRPTEIGSLRSARHDFIPLAMGCDAILAHWGGSHFALEKLNQGIMDNIDALKNPFDAFYRKSSLPKPHNGFTSMKRLIRTAEKLGYRLKNEFEGYPHSQIPNKSQIPNSKRILKIDYPHPYNVEYQYNPQTNSYLRWRGNKPELDRNDGFQIEAKNIVIMRAASRQIYGQYNDVDVEGSGQCQVYQNGQVINGTWQKNKADPASKLYFLDQAGQEIPFVPGQIWIEIVEPDQEVKWE